MEIVNNIFKRTRKNPIGKIMIDESMRPISSRETVQDYMNYQNKRKAQIAQEKKEQFEESLRQSAVREVKSGSALYSVQVETYLNNN